MAPCKTMNFHSIQVTTMVGLDANVKILPRWPVSFPFDCTGIFGVNKNSFLKLSLSLLSDSFTDVATHSLRYDISLHPGEIVMSQNLS